MNAKTLIPLVVAIALGGVAAKMGKDMMGKGRGNDGPAIKFSKQVVAKEDLAPGTTIKETDVTVKDMPADARAEQSFANVADVVGRVVTTQIVKNQAVMNTLLAPSGSAGGMGAMIPPGMRAVTLEVNEVSGLAGLLIPGAKVDLVQTIQVKGGDQGMMAKTIVENVQVLAVGRRTSTVANAAGQEGDPLAHSVTLLATTEQAEAIDLASHVGSPRLVLRNSADKKSVNSKGITVATLRGDEDRDSEDAYDKMLADVFGGGNNPPAPAPKPTADPVKPSAVAADVPKVKNYRDVEVIRAGASTSVRIGLNPEGAGTFTGGRDGDKKLFGDD
jgi:pilus assembly protein CpaB